MATTGKVACIKASGKVVAVTGGAMGIGAEIARQLAAAGAHVAIGDRDLAAAEATAAEVAGDVVAFELDVTDTASFTGFLDAVEHRWNRLDVLVNNAGMMWVGPFETEPDTASRSQIEINLHGMIHGVQLAAPAMRARGHGQIITIASAASKLPPAGEATYAATKHGIYGYLTAVRTELHGSGVQLSVIMPGVVDTALAAGTNTGPIRRLVPADVAQAVLRMITRPRFEVSVPRRLGAVARLAAILPDRARYLLLRTLVPNQAAADPDKTVWRGCETNPVTDTEESSP